MRQEFERAAGLWSPSEEDYWEVRIGDQSLFQCPYRRRIFSESLEGLSTITKNIDQAIRSGLEQAELVILTLGLTEVWLKKDNGKASNSEPGYCGGGGAEETEFLASKFEDNIQNMRLIADLLRDKFGNPRCIVTTSPVPLGRTFRSDTDVLVANSESKAILRAVAGQISDEYPDVSYFPAFELAQFDPFSFVEDGRHVRQDKITQIMNLFSQTFME